MTGLRRGAAVGAGVLAAVSSMNVATTFLPTAPVFGMGPTFGLFLVSMGATGAVILWMLRRSSRRGMSSGAARAEVNDALADQWRLLPGRRRRSFTVLLLALWLCALSGFLLRSGGAPHEEDGRYYLNEHGAETDVTREEYEHELQLSIRSYASGSAMLFLLAYGVLRYYRPPGGSAVTPPS